MRTQPIFDCFSMRRGQGITTSLIFFMIPLGLRAQDDTRKAQWGIVTGLLHAGALGVNPQFGLVYERKFSRHSNLESGIRWMHSYSKSTGFTETGAGRVSHYSKEVHHYFSMPVLYKFSSPIINVSAGPVLSLMAGRFEANEPRRMPMSFEKPLNTPDVGALFKIGKAFHFKDRFVLEPEAGVFKSGYFKKPVWETSVTLKYKW